MKHCRRRLGDLPPQGQPPIRRQLVNETERRVVEIEEVLRCFWDGLPRKRGVETAAEIESCFVVLVHWDRDGKIVGDDYIDDGALVVCQSEKR